MKNLAGNKKADETIRTELRAARIPIKVVPQSEGEVPYTLIGVYGPWTVRRAWYYHVAHAEQGQGLPKEKAEKLNREWREQVRVQGHAGGTDVDHWLTPEGTIDCYHIDTQRGLEAFYEAIQQ